MSDHPGRTEPRTAPSLLAQDSRRLFGSISLAVVGQAGAIAAGLGCMIVTTRLLGPGGYGLLAMFFVFQEVLSKLFGWADLGLVRFGREELAEGGRFSETFWARFLIFFASLVAAAALLFAAQRPLNTYLRLNATAHVLLLGYVGMTAFILMLRSVFQTATRFRAYAATTFGVRALKLVVILAVFVFLAWSADAAAIIRAHLAAMVVVILCALVLLPWRQLLPVRFVSRTIRRVATYSWPLLFGGLAVLVVNWVDLVVIKHFHTSREVGWYAVAYQPVTVLATLRVSFIAAILPLLVSMAVERKHAALVWYLDEALPQLAWVAGMGCVLVAGAVEVIPLVLGDAYRPSVVPCQVLTAAVAFSVVVALHEAMAQAVGRVRASVGVLLILAAVNALLDILLVPRIGILGAGLATTAAYAVCSFLYFPLLNSVQCLRGSRPGRRYQALLGLAPPLALAGCVSMLANPAQRIVTCCAILLSSMVLARLAGVFKADTLERLSHVRMPIMARKLLFGFYRVLGR